MGSEFSRHEPPRTKTVSIVEIGKARIETTVTKSASEIDLVVKKFLANEMNTKKIIGLSTEQGQYSFTVDRKSDQERKRGSRTVLLELCDGDHCLVVQLLPSDHFYPPSLFNFLNLPEYTFVGVDIKKTLERLEREWGLTCKSAVEIGPSKWNLSKKTDHEKGKLEKLFLMEKPRPVFGSWNISVLNENQIELATSHAYVPFAIGNVLLYDF